MIVLGIDPDLHRTGWAIVESDPLKVKKVGIASVPTKIKGAQAVVAMRHALPRSLPECYNYDLTVVESQEVYFAKSKANPNNLIFLAQVAGICAAFCPTEEIWMPRPVNWKGQIPKPIHHDRILRSVGLSPIKQQNFCFPGPPLDFELINVGNQTDWKHIVDAIGLACWGITRASRLRQISETASESASRETP